MTEEVTEREREYQQMLFMWQLDMLALLFFQLSSMLEIF